MLSDAEALAERARSAGVSTELQHFGDLWHVFQLHAGLLREADEALGKIAHFMHCHARA